MGFTQSIKTCFGKYITFSGRASRSEYWWFSLFIVLGSIVAGIVDNILFGTGSVQATHGNGVVGFSAKSNGPLGTVFALATLLPALAAGWRRMHDSGRSGLFLLYPMIALVGLMSFVAMMGGLPAFMGGPNGPAGHLVGVIIALAAIIAVLSPLLVLWWLTRPSQPGPNQYGPNPLEVTQ